MILRHFIFFLLGYLFLFTACKKVSQPIGLEVQPDYDLLQASTKAVQPVELLSIRVDSIQISNTALKYLGANQDPFFGRTDVGLCLNANLSGSLVDFGSQAEFQSAEIILEASGLEYMGDAATAMSYSVFSIDSALSVKNKYYSTQKPVYSSTSVVGAYTGSYTTIEGKVVVRIPVFKSFADSILKNPQYTIDNSTFQKRFKGFYISCSSSALNPSGSPGIVTLFDLSTALSGFYLRYKRTPTSVEESYRFSFTGDAAVRYNTIDYYPFQGGHFLLTQQLKGDSAKAQEDAFLKGLGCLSVNVKIPGLKSTVDSFYTSVNRAEVVFNVDELFTPTLGKYEAPPILTLIPLNSDGTESYGGHSYNVSNLSRYDGKYNSSTKQYVFDIARYAQLVVNGERQNYGFRLVVADPDFSKFIFRDIYQNRIVLHGSNKGTLSPRFTLYYVKLREP